MENSDKQQSRNSVVSGGLYNTISLNSSAEKHCKLSQIKSGGKNFRSEGNLRDVEQGNLGGKFTRFPVTFGSYIEKTQ